MSFLQCGDIGHAHRGERCGGGEDVGDLHVPEEGVLSEGGSFGEVAVEEVAALEASFAEVPPLCEGDRLAVRKFHGEGVGLDNVCLEDYLGCSCPLGFCVWAEEVHEDRAQVIATDLGVVLEQFDAVGPAVRSGGVRTRSCHSGPGR